MAACPGKGLRVEPGEAEERGGRRRPSGAAKLRGHVHRLEDVAHLHAVGGRGALPPWLVTRALEQLRSEGGRRVLAKKMTTVAALHEVAHACGVPGHLASNEKGSMEESSEGDRTCPMRYPYKTDLGPQGVLEVLFRENAGLPLQYLMFCRGDQGGNYKCFEQINVKD